MLGRFWSPNIWQTRPSSRSFCSLEGEARGGADRNVRRTPGQGCPLTWEGVPCAADGVNQKSVGGMAGVSMGPGNRALLGAEAGVHVRSWVGGALSVVHGMAMCKGHLVSHFQYAPSPFVLKRACPHTATPCFRTFGSCLEIVRVQSNAECGLSLCAGCGQGQHGCQSVGVAVMPCTGAGACAGLLLCTGMVWVGVAYACNTRPWYVLRGNAGLSKHGDPVFPHFCPLKQTVARVGGGGYVPSSAVMLVLTLFPLVPSSCMRIRCVLCAALPNSSTTQRKFFFGAFAAEYCHAFWAK